MLEVAAMGITRIVLEWYTDQCSFSIFLGVFNVRSATLLGVYQGGISDSLEIGTTDDQRSARRIFLRNAENIGK